MPFGGVSIAHPGAVVHAHDGGAQFAVGGLLPQYTAVAPGPVGASSAPGTFHFVSSAPSSMQPPAHHSFSPGGTLHSTSFHLHLPNTHASCTASPGASAFTTSSSPQQQQPQQSFRNLKVGGLPPDATDADLLSLFERFGKIISAKVMINVQTCESRGYGFVLFDTQEAGCRAFGEMNGKTVTLHSGQQPITLDLKNSDWDGRQAAAETTCIYVRNLPNTVSDDELRAMFSKFGVIVQLQTRLQPGLSGLGAVGGSAISLAGSNSSSLVSNATTARNSPPTGGVSVGSSIGASSFPGSTPLANLSDTPPHTNLSWSSAAVLTSSFPSSSAASTSISVSSEGNVGFGKMAMIEYGTIEQARAAIAGSHRVVMFPNVANITVLSKFADSPSLRESKRQQKRPTAPSGPYGAPKVVVAPPPQVTVGSRVVSRGVTHGTNSSSGIRGADGTVGFLVSGGGAAAPPPPPSTSALRHSYSSPPHVVGSFPTGATIADAVPLPVARTPGAWQRVYFQGMLGITPDGLLYPLRVDECKEVDFSATPSLQEHLELHGFAQKPAVAATSQPQQQPLHGFSSIDGLMDLVNASRGVSASTRVPNGTVPTFYVLPPSSAAPPEQQQSHDAQQQRQFSFQLPGSVVLET